MSHSSVSLAIRTRGIAIRPVSVALRTVLPMTVVVLLSRGQITITTQSRHVDARTTRMLFEYADADGDGSLALIEFIELVRQMRSLVCTTELFYFATTLRLNVSRFSKL